MTGLLDDLRFAWRSLRRRPLFLFPAVATLALYGIAALDPATYVAVALLLALVALAACLLPAWRATRLAPAIALRGE